MTTQSKITLWSVLIAFVVMAVLGWAAHYTLKATLVEISVERLTLVRDVKAEKVETYFSDRIQTLEPLGRDARIIEAMEDFGTAFTKISAGEDVLPENMSAILRQKYDRKILPSIKQRLGHAPANDNDFWPRRNAAQYLHYQYVSPPDTPSIFQTDYQAAHLRHHETLATLSENMGARDLLLIDPETGDVIYTVNKDVDLGLNILTGPYRTEAMVDLYNFVKSMPGQVGASDLVAYLPDANVNSLFIGAPIIQENATIGILMMRLSSEELTDMVSAKMDWDNIGLGQTGDIYLAGPDYFMRSNSRFAQKDIKAFVDDLRMRGVETSMVKQIDRQGSTVLVQEVKTDDVAAALQSRSGVVRTRDYRGAKVISAYAPLNIPNLNWVIIAKQDSAEVLAPMHKRVWRVAAFVPLLLLFIWSLSRWFGLVFVKSREQRKTPEHEDHLLKSTSRVLDAMHDEETS